MKYIPVTVSVEVLNPVIGCDGPARISLISQDPRNGSPVVLVSFQIENGELQKALSSYGANRIAQTKLFGKLEACQLDHVRFNDTGK